DWDCGDGDSKHTTVPTTTHDFITTGAFTVTLTVTDDAGHKGVASVQVTIGGDNPTADFTFSPSSPKAGTPVNFNAGGSSATNGRTITSYAWDFGDGATGTGVTPPAHTYASAGTFNVTLTVTDSAGKVGRKTLAVTVQ